MRNLLNKNHKNFIFFFGLFLLTLLISLRRLILETKITGHNWDWVFPATNFLFKNLNLPTKYTWWEMNLGTVSDLNLSHLVPDTILVSLAHVLEPKWVIFIFLVSVIAFSFIFFKKLLDNIGVKSNLNYLPSFLYAFSPLLFNEIIGGSWYMWLSSAFAPIFFVQLLSFIKNFKIKNLLFFLLVGIFVISSLQNFVLVEAIFLFYLTYLVIFEKFSWKKAILGYSLSHFVLILFNLYWLAPFLVNFAHFKVSPVFAGDFFSVRASTQNIGNILSLTGYLDRNMYYHALPDFLVLPFAFSVAIVWLMVGSLFFRNASKNFLFWFVSLVVAAFFIKGGNPPLGEATMWFYEKIPLFRLYRSPQHTMFAASLIIPILVAFALHNYYFAGKRKKLIVGIFAVFILVWISGWWFNGDLGQQILLRKKKDHLDFYSLSPELEEIYRRNQSALTDYRTLFLPSAWSVKYLPTEYQNQAEGGQAEYMYLKNPTFTGSFTSSAEELEFSFCQPEKNDGRFISYLSLFSVKDIILRKDIYPLFTQAKNCWNPERTKAILDTNPYLEKFSEKKYAVGYEIEKGYFLPRFYIPQKITYFRQNIPILTTMGLSRDEELRSAFFSGGDIGELKEMADEIQEIIQPKLIAAPGEEIIVERDVEYQYHVVIHDPQNFFWKLVLLKENFFEWQAKGDKQVFLKLELFYANKRVSELEKFKILDPTPLIKIYQEKIRQATELLEELGEKEKEANQRKIRNNLLYNLQKIREISARDSTKKTQDWEKLIVEWLKKLEKPAPPSNPLVVKYEFGASPKGEYLLFLEDSGGLFRKPEANLKKWKISVDGQEIHKEIKLEKDSRLIQVGKIFLKEGKSKGELQIDYSALPPARLEGENRFFQTIKDWPAEMRFYVSGSAQFADEGVRLAIDETVIDTQNKIAPNLVKELIILLKDSQFDFYTKSTKTALGAKIYFVPKDNPEKFYQESQIRELKIFPLYTPKIFLKFDKGEMAQQKKEKKLPQITFTKINPTKYRLKIEGASEPYVLIFNENFNKNWKLYLDRQQNEEVVASYFDGAIKEGKHQDVFLELATFETWGRKPMVTERHFLVNGYANSWLIKPEDVQFQENYELIVEFWPQRLFYLGLFLNSVILMSFPPYLLINLMKRKKVVRNL